MKGKRGWMRILEATMAVMIVASVMLVSYSGRIYEGVSVSEYIGTLQDEILLDIVSDGDLRLKILNIVVDDSSDSNYIYLNDFVESRVFADFGYLLRVCELGQPCKMDSNTYISTLDKDVFVKDIIISAEIGEGGGVEIFNPKKVKLFFWMK